MIEFTEHPQRRALAAEIHARPYLMMRPPIRISHVAAMSGERNMEAPPIVPCALRAPNQLERAFVGYGFRVVQAVNRCAASHGSRHRRPGPSTRRSASTGPHVPA